MTIDEQKVTAEELKNRGNEAYKGENFREAFDFYTRAIELKPESGIEAMIYRNRAMVRLKIRDYEGCEADATHGLFLFVLYD